MKKLLLFCAIGKFTASGVVINPQNRVKIPVECCSRFFRSDHYLNDDRFKDIVMPLIPLALNFLPRNNYNSAFLFLLPFFFQFLPVSEKAHKKPISLKPQFFFTFYRLSTCLIHISACHGSQFRNESIAFQGADSVQKGTVPHDYAKSFPVMEPSEVGAILLMFAESDYAQKISDEGRISGRNQR